MATHSTWWVTGSMSPWTQAGKQQVRDAFWLLIGAAGRPERHMSITALRRFGTDTLAQ